MPSLRRKPIYYGLLAALAVALPTLSQVLPTDSVADPAVPAAGPGADEIIVRFRPGTHAADRGAARDQADAEFKRPLAVPRAQLLRVEDGQTVEQALKQLEANPDVDYAEPNAEVKAFEAPDDARFGELWGLNNTGQTVGGQQGVPGADVGALSAWTSTTGSRDVVVAVVDTGIDRAHPDLAENVWTNPGEDGALKSNGVDDDGNGFVDDWRGWNFYSDGNDPDDGHYHGTHVAGTIGAVGGNGVGVTGVSQRVSLVGVKVLSDSGSGTFADVADGFVYAGKIGADVANASLGGSGPSKLIEDSIAASPDTLFVVAAGNDYSDVASYPKTPCVEPNENLVCVAATDNRDALAYFSNWGVTSVDLGAPGLNVLSTRPDNTYGLLSGTSMASPHVAGAAALVTSAWPTESPLELKNRLLEGAQAIPALAGKTVSGGRLDVAATLGLPANEPPVPELEATPATARTQERVALDASGSTDPDGSISEYDWDLDGNGSFETRSGGRATAGTAFDAVGTATVGVRVRDQRGGTASATVEVPVTAAPEAAPVARIAAVSPVYGGVSFELDGSGSTATAGVTRYEWDLDGDYEYEVDGGAAPKRSHTFPKVGTFPVGLRVTDADGAKSETRRAITVQRASPIADFTHTPAYPVEKVVASFDASASKDPDGTIYYYEWDFNGDGYNDSYSRQPSYTFPAAGEYKVRLEVEDNDRLVGSVTKTVFVRPPYPFGPVGPPRVQEEPGDSDGDGVFDPGEGLVVEQDARNYGDDEITGVRGLLRAPEGDTLRPAAPGTWPTLGGETPLAPTAPLTAKSYGNLACGVPMTLNVDIKTDQGDGTFPITLPPTGKPGARKTWADPELPFTVPAGYYKSKTLKVSGLQGGIHDVDVKIGSLKAAQVRDVELVLVPPGTDGWAKAVDLVYSRSGSGSNMTETVFDDAAATPIGSGQPPYTGRFRPETPLSALNGRSANGTWTLYVDNWSDSAATLESFGLDAQQTDCADARNKPPVAALQRTPSQDAVVGQPMTLSAAGSTDADGRIVEYRWDLDGNGSYEVAGAAATAVKTWDSVGSRLVRLQVVDDKRGVAKHEAWITVRPSYPPVPALKVSPAALETGVPATYDAGGSKDPDGTITAYRWDFGGEGNFDAEGRVVKRTFTEPGMNTTILEVKDNTGNLATLWSSSYVWPKGTVPQTLVTPTKPIFPPRVVPPPRGQKPTLTVSGKVAPSRATLRKGLTVVARCDRSCRVLGDLLQARPSSSRVRAPLVVAEGSRVIGSPVGGRSKVTLRLTAAGRKLVARPGRVRLTLRLRAQNGWGTATQARPLTLRR